MPQIQSHVSPLPLVSITSSKMLLLSTQFLVNRRTICSAPGSNTSTGWVFWVRLTPSGIFPILLPKKCTQLNHINRNHWKAGHEKKRKQTNKQNTVIWEESHLQHFFFSDSFWITRGDQENQHFEISFLNILKWRKWN